MFAKKLLVAAVAVLSAGTAVAVETAPPPREVKSPKTFTVQMRDKPWKEVLDWYAEQSGLVPIYTVAPKGTVTLLPPKDRRFTLAEVTDLLNEKLVEEKFLLIRRLVSFTVVRTDEKIG